MSEQHRVIETQGKDVEEAIETGLAQLGLSRSDVIVEVIEEGSRGFLGLGGRDSVVRLTALSAPKRAPERTMERQPETPAEAPHPAPGDHPGNRDTVAVAAAPPVVRRERETAPAATDEDAAAIVALVEGLIERMGFEADVSASYTEPDDVTGRQMLLVDVAGDEIGAMIGTRGEALNALQYVVRLMSGHRLQRRINVLLDIDGYRERRRQALTRLAQRMSKKVLQRGRPVTLEAMPPFERRIVHMALAEDAGVYTQSVGEGKRRRVRIYPKRK